MLKKARNDESAIDEFKKGLRVPDTSYMFKRKRVSIDPAADSIAVRMKTSS